MSALGPTRYRLFGLTLDSEIELPELPGQVHSIEDAPADISIKLGGSPPPGKRFELNIAKIARFTVVDGRSITVTPEADAGQREIRLFLLGSAMGAALHQRGMLPLHANAVAIDGRAVAFMGRSGAGKSTLAAWFHDRGCGVLADDVCVISAEGPGAVMAYPGMPRLRLWVDALEASGRSPDRHHPSFHRESDRRRKYDVLIGPQATADRPAPLSALFLLEEGPELLIERLTGSAAVDAISANTYRGRLVSEIGDSEAHVAACVTVARTTPVFRLERPMDHTSFDTYAEAILDYCRALPPSG